MNHGLPRDQWTANQLGIYIHIPIPDLALIKLILSLVRLLGCVRLLLDGLLGCWVIRLYETMCLTFGLSLGRVEFWRLKNKNKI